MQLVPYVGWAGSRHPGRLVSIVGLPDLAMSAMLVMSMTTDLLRAAQRADD